MKTDIGKVYIAALFSRREEMEMIAHSLKLYGVETVSSWVFGGEDGLSREEIALLDLRDVDRSDTVISFTHPKGTLTPGGGRHVEFGYGLAKGKKLVVIGERECVFHHHPSVKVYPTVDKFVATELV